MKLNNKKLLLPLAISMAIYGPTTLGQESEDDNADDDNVVIVTAQKRSERLTEVPIAMSVFAEDKIDQTGVQELRELGDFIPNMIVTQGTDFNSRILIRGVGAPSRNIGFDSRVGVYLDGVYLGQGPSVNQDLVDLAQVEILRGPQGTLFGKNTVAGAVSMVSKKPDEFFEGKITVGWGNYNARETKANLNLPLADNMYAKIAVSDRVRDGYITNVYQEGTLPTTFNLVSGGVPFFNAPLPAPIETFTPPDTTNPSNDQNTQSYRVQFRLAASDNLDINLAFDGLESARSSTLGVPITTTFGDTPYSYADVANNEINESFKNRELRNINGTSLNIEYDFDNGYSFRSITGMRQTEIEYGNDTDYSPFDFIYLFYKDNYDQNSQEFQLISPDESDMKFVLGAYFYEQTADTIRNAIAGNAGWTFGITPGGGAFNNGNVETSSTAFYFNGSYDFSETWSVSFGARWSDEDKDVLWNLDGSNSGSFGIGTTPAGGLVDSRNDSNFSPAVSLNYAHSADTNMYVKYSTGFKSGGYNLDFVTQADLVAGLEFDKETVDSMEFGLKTALLDNRMSLNIAYFDSQYEDYQVNQFFDLGTAADGTPLTSIRIENAAEVDTSGLEAEMNYRMTDALTLTASLGFLDATFASFPDGASREILTSSGTLARVPEDAAGKKLPGAPEFTGAFGIEYYSEISDWEMDLLFRLDVTHRGEHFTTINNLKERIVPGTHPLTFAFDIANYQGAATTLDTVDYGFIEATTMVNARIGLLPQNNGFEVYIWGRNLTDEDEPVDSFREFFGTLVNTPRTPMTWGVEFIYSFE